MLVTDLVPRNEVTLLKKAAVALNACGASIQSMELSERAYRVENDLTVISLEVADDAEHHYLIRALRGTHRAKPRVLQTPPMLLAEHRVEVTVDRSHADWAMQCMTDARRRYRVQ